MNGKINYPLIIFMVTVFSVSIYSQDTTGETNPEKTVEKYLTALKNNDYNTIVECIDSTELRSIVSPYLDLFSADTFGKVIRKLFPLLKNYQELSTLPFAED